jgi:dTDP-4-amino-4,6-dideoxygalactose transaminase
VPEECQTNSHLFFAVFQTAEVQDRVLTSLNGQHIRAVFHYVPLHTSPMGREFSHSLTLPVTDRVSRSLLRLPFFYEITFEEQVAVADAVGHALGISCSATGVDLPEARNSSIRCVDEVETIPATA